MIQLKALSAVLNNTLDNDLQTCVLLNTDGSLVSYGGPNVKFAKTVASIVSNIWYAYDRHGRPVGGGGASVVAAELGESKEGKVVIPPTLKPAKLAVPDETLKSLLIDCEVV